MGKFASNSRGLLKISTLKYLLDNEISHTSFLSKEKCDAILCWGLKPSSIKADVIAKKYTVPLLRIEDGFIRSVQLGFSAPPLSIVIDDIGIYYDAKQPSRLEELILRKLSDEQLLRTRNLIHLWQINKVSKYNFSKDISLASYAKYVLVADQTFGDLSIRHGCADISSFHRMLDAALNDYPEHLVLLKIHPDVVLGKKRGHFDIEALKLNPRIVVISADVHPVCLIERADAVYCVTSQIGFESLLWGKSVHTFGMPFYAGWGLTYDALQQPGRRTNVPLENLVYAALVAYPRYIDPETNCRCEVERLVEWMGLQVQMRKRFPENVEACHFSFYKRSIVKRFFQGSKVRFNRRPNQWSKDSVQVIWGNKSKLSHTHDTVRLEDGFIRSVGLGAELALPVSWVMDTQGIYFDASQLSDLEVILQYHVFSGTMLERARKIRTRIIDGYISKYNVGRDTWIRKDNPESTLLKVILVPGQVESDASIIFGSPEIKTNLDLLKAVRVANPDAYIIYKMHPDVVSGLRKGGVNEGFAKEFCNLVLTDVSIAYLFDHVDEVHTLTSLAGFEALLRNKKVVCYGLPFYAGWGLTEDKVPLPRRSRRLSIDELVAGAIIFYPTYISRVTGKFTTPERALDELLIWRDKSLNILPWWKQVLRVYLRMESFITSIFI